MTGGPILELAGHELVCRAEVDELELLPYNLRAIGADELDQTLDVVDLVGLVLDEASARAWRDLWPTLELVRLLEVGAAIRELISDGGIRLVAPAGGDDASS